MNAETFDRYVEEAIESLPDAIAELLDNVAIVVDDEPPDDDTLGYYEGVPQTERGSSYGGELPDLITIYSGPLVRDFGHDQALLRAEIRRTVLHEIAHHFGIDDDRLVEIDRY